MTVRHIFVDETKRREYVLVAASVLGDDLAAARAVVKKLLKPGQRHLHMKNEADGRKETIAKALVAGNLRATVYDAGRRRGSQVLARAACLSALVDDVATSGVDTLIVLDQDETLVHFDRRLLYRSVHAVGRARVALRAPAVTHGTAAGHPRCVCLVLGEGWTLAVLDSARRDSARDLEKARNPSATVVRPGLGLTFRSYCRRQPNTNRVTPQLAT